MAVYTLANSLDTTLQMAALAYLEQNKAFLGSIDPDSIGRVKQLALHTQHRPLVELCLLAERQRLHVQTKAKRDVAAQRAMDLTMDGAPQEQVNGELAVAAKADAELVKLEQQLGKQP